VLGEDLYTPWCEHCDKEITVEDKEEAA
jgi:thiol-disulfide isomerase/thioredoxin